MCRSVRVSAAEQLLQKKSWSALCAPRGIMVDPTGKTAGRGAYIHKIRSCWEQALKGPINHALRVEITAADRQMLQEYADRLPEGENLTGPEESLTGKGNKD